MAISLCRTNAYLFCCRTKRKESEESYQRKDWIPSSTPKEYRIPIYKRIDFDESLTLLQHCSEIPATLQRSSCSIAESVPAELQWSSRRIAESVPAALQETVRILTKTPAVLQGFYVLYCLYIVFWKRRSLLYWTVYSPSWYCQAMTNLLNSFISSLV